jgi:hypothetical protein
MGPDTNEVAFYYRCRTRAQARIVCEGMERWWTIVKVIHRGKDLAAEYEFGRPQTIKTAAQARRARDWQPTPSTVGRAGSAAAERDPQDGSGPEGVVGEAR